MSIIELPPQTIPTVQGGAGALLSGTGAPASTLGILGDWYFRTDNYTAGQRVYQKILAGTITMRPSTGTSAATGAGSSIGVTIPAATQLGDLMVCTGLTLSVNIGTPAGWTLLAQNSFTTGGSTCYTSVFTRICQGSDNNGSTVVTLTGSGAVAAMFSAYYYPASTPVNVDTFAAPAEGESANSASVTTTVANCDVLTIVYAVNSGAGNVGLTPPSGTTDITFESNGFAAGAIVENQQPAAGASPALGSTTTQNAYWGIWTVALAPNVSAAWSATAV
jgi:hypothetical protein